jgi:hypothetical protein
MNWFDNLMSSSAHVRHSLAEKLFAQPLTNPLASLAFPSAASSMCRYAATCGLTDSDADGLGAAVAALPARG